MSKKIIVLVIPALYSDGAARVVLNLASGFLQYNYQVNIILFKNIINFEVDKRIKICIFRHYYRFIPRSIRGKILSIILDKFIIKECGYPDLILSNSIYADMVLSHSKLKNVFLINHTMISKREKPCSKNIKQLVSTYTKKPVISVSYGVMNDLKIVFKNNSLPDLHLIYNPINVKSIKHLSNIKHKFNSQNYIIHVGRFSQSKRHDILIKAYNKSGVDNYLVLVGDGASKKENELLVNSLNLTNKIIFVGFQDNPYPLIKNAKLMVLSSDFEGLPTVILEGLVLNVPVISTDCPSGPSEILPSKNLSPVGDINKLAELIKKAIDNPAQYQHPLHEKFTLNYAVKKYLKLII